MIAPRRSAAQPSLTQGRLPGETRSVIMDFDNTSIGKRPADLHGRIKGEGSEE